MVYDDAEKLYAEVKADGQALLEAAFRVLFPHSHGLPLPSSPSSPLVPDGEIVAYNTTFLPRQDIIRIPREVLGVKGQELVRRQAVQMGKDGEGYVLMESREGAGLARSSGMFADCMPVSGKIIASRATVQVC